MKKLFFLFFIISFFFLIIKPVFSQERYVSCDLCGFCPSANPTPPSNWEKCVRCLYPGIVPNPTIKSTLKIDPQTNLPPTPFPGRHFTMIGCVQTSGGGFTSEEGVISIGQLFLNIIFSVVGGFAFITLVYGAFIIITSQNNPEKLDYGKRLIYGAIIGLIFSLSSVFIVRLIASDILKIPGFGGF
ncbi:MAG: hypothetical protein ACPL1D_00245 [Microgenomates group bacterium]